LGYIDFILENESTTEDNLLSLLMNNITETPGRMSQMAFIEGYILGIIIISLFIYSFAIGDHKAIKYSTNLFNWTITADSNYKKTKGCLLRIFLREKGIFQDPTNHHHFIDELSTLLGDYNEKNVKIDGGVTTRAHIPFLRPPEPPKFCSRSNLVHARKEQLVFIQNELRPNVGLSKNGKKMLNEIMAPFFTMMSNLPGGVHNCGTETMVQIVERLNLDPSSSVLLECGSGAPLLGLQSSIWTKQTICVDLPAVMNIVYSVISCMSPIDSMLIKTLHLVSGIYSSLCLLMFFSGYFGYATK